MTLLDLKTKLINAYPSGNLEALEEYLSICSNNDIDEYTEKHHILPQHKFPEFKSLAKNKWNCVNLNFVNHSLAHYHYAKFCNTMEAWSALSMVGRGLQHSFRKGEATIEDLKYIANLTAIGRKNAADLYKDADAVSEWRSKVEASKPKYIVSLRKHQRAKLSGRLSSIKKLYPLEKECLLLDPLREGVAYTRYKPVVLYWRKIGRDTEIEQRKEQRVLDKHQRMLDKKQNTKAKREARLNELSKDWRAKLDHVLNKGTQTNLAIWNKFEELYQLWLDNGQCGKAKMRRVAVENGYADTSYQAMWWLFRERLGQEG